MGTPGFVYDSVRAEQAVDHLAKHFQRTKVSTNCKPNLDMRLVAVVLLTVHRYASKPKVRETFALLPPELFEIRHLELLPDLAWSAWYGKVRCNELIAAKARSTVPSDFAERIADRKRRMLRVLEYHLHDDPASCNLLRAIRKGGRRFDDATGLTALAGLYRTHKAVLATDTLYYREDDVRGAEEEAAMLMRILRVGLENELKEANNLLARIYIRVQESYDEVRAAACFGFRHRPEHLEHFPLLHTAVRRARKSATIAEEQPEQSEKSQA